MENETLRERGYPEESLTSLRKSGEKFEESGNIGYYSIYYSLEKELIKAGYLVGGCTYQLKGSPYYHFSDDHLGIMKKETYSKKRSLLGLIKWSEEKEVIEDLGVLWLNNRARGAREDKYWVLELENGDTIDELGPLISKMAKENGVNVGLRIK